MVPLAVSREGRAILPQSALVLCGGVVLLVGMLVGFWYGAAVVAKSDSVSRENWRVAHIQNLQNGMLLLLVGACVNYLRLSPTALAAMAWLLIAAAYCDMVAWFIRAATGYEGRLPTPPLANVVVFALFAATVLGQIVGISIFIFGAWQAMSTATA